MLTKTLSEAKKKQRASLIKAMNNDIGSIESAKDSWNPAQISERAKEISYIRSLVDSWNPAQLNEALKMLDLPVIDTWNPAQIEDQRRNLVFYLAERTLTGNPIILKILGNLTPEVTNLKVTMNPIQDLHGYDNPWVGGAGKNKLPMTVSSIKALNTGGTWSGNVYTRNDVTFTILTDESDNVIGIQTNGTPSANTSFIVSQYTGENLGFILNGCPSGGSDSTYRLTANNGGNDYGNGVSITSGWNGYVSIYIYAQVNNLVFQPMIRLSTVTDATFAPYSNICPISGRTEASVTRTGKNFFDTSLFQRKAISGGTGEPFDSTTRIMSNDVIVEAGSYTYQNSNNYKTALYVYNADGSYPAPENEANWSTTNPRTVTFGGKRIVRLIFAKSNDATITLDEIGEVQIEKGSTATAYEPYTAETKTHQYSETIHGGVDDFVNGGLLVEWGYIASYDEETLPGEWISDRDVYAPNTTPTIGAEVAYKLSEAVSIETTPEEITLLKGTNVLSTDGDSIELKYKQNF